MSTYLQSGLQNDCCGCGACVDICPTNAISMIVGNDASLYPKVDLNICKSCEKCKKVCPMNYSPRLIQYEPKAYAGYLKDESLRNKSASGGAFEAIIASLEKNNADLLVAGAIWDGTKVKHVLVEASKREKLKKSKYSQSESNEIYKKVEKSLKENKQVVFTGTPCQCVALKNYLKVDYDNLLVVDIVCHGVPGNKILSRYIEEIEKKYHSNVINISFREKKKDIYGEIHSDYMRVELSKGKVLMGNKKTNDYLIGFHKGVFYRESCYSCKYATPQRYSDITIGDYWHIQKKYPALIDYSGISCVLVNSAKGEKTINNIDNFELLETDVDYLIKHNGQLNAPSEKPISREAFFRDLDSKSFSKNIHNNVARRKVMNNMVSSLLPRQLKHRNK